MAAGTIDYQRIYRAVPLFKDLTEAELDAIMEFARLFRADKGTVLVQQGQHGSGLYIVVNGSARVTARDPAGKETTLAIVGRGVTIGELSLIDEAPHSANVICEELCTLLHVDTAGFNKLRAMKHPAAYKLLRATAPMICERLRAINERIATIFVAAGGQAEGS